MDNWDEVRTAYRVAGSGRYLARRSSGVHHATVIRHIDALEDRMKVKLFKGMRAVTPRLRRGRICCAWRRRLTISSAARRSPERAGRRRIGGTGGDLPGFDGDAGCTDPADFQAMYSDLIIRYLTGDRLFRWNMAKRMWRSGLGPRRTSPITWCRNSTGSRRRCMPAKPTSLGAACPRGRRILQGTALSGMTTCLAGPRPICGCGQMCRQSRSFFAVQMSVHWMKR